MNSHKRDRDLLRPLAEEYAALDVQRERTDETGSCAASHEYRDQLKDEQDLEKLALPEITYDNAATIDLYLAYT